MMMVSPIFPIMGGEPSAGAAARSNARAEAAICRAFSRVEAGIDPRAKAPHVFGRPCPVARHRAVGKPLVDPFGVGTYVVVGRQIEVGGHRPHVAVVEQRSDAPRKSNVLFHLSSSFRRMHEL